MRRNTFCHYSNLFLKAEILTLSRGDRKSSSPCRYMARSLSHWSQNIGQIDIDRMECHGFKWWMHSLKSNRFVNLSPGCSF